MRCNVQVLFMHPAWVGIHVSYGYDAYKCLQVADQYNEHWRTDWVTSDFWHVLNFAFLCVIAFLWRPSVNAQRFAYSELDGKVLAHDAPGFTAVFAQDV